MKKFLRVLSGTLVLACFGFVSYNMGRTHEGTGPLDSVWLGDITYLPTGEAAKG